MRLFKVFFLSMKKVPFKTNEIVRYNDIIIKKKDKKDFKDSEKYKEAMKQIERHGNLLSPIKVKKADFNTRKYIITDYVEGYLALVDNHIYNIPIEF